MEPNLKKIIRIAIESLPHDAPAGDVVNFILNNQRALIYLWLLGQVERQRKAFTTGAAPRPKGRAGRRPHDPRQGWLDLPEFQHIPIEAKDDSEEAFNRRIAALEHKIKFDERPRVSAEKARADKRELREMRLLKSKIAPFFKADPSLTVGQAAERYAHQARKR